MGCKNKFTPILSTLKGCILKINTSNYFDKDLVKSILEVNIPNDIWKFIRFYYREIDKDITCNKIIVEYDLFNYSKL